MMFSPAGCGKSELYQLFREQVRPRSRSHRSTARVDLGLPAGHREGRQLGRTAALGRSGARTPCCGRRPLACPLGSIAAELKNDDAYLPSLNAAFRMWEAPLARGLEEMRQRGQLSRQSDPARLARSVIAALQGGMLMSRVHDNPTIMKDAVDNALLDLRRRALPRARGDAR